MGWVPPYITRPTGRYPVMAKPPPAAAAAPVLDQEVDSTADGEAAPKKRFSLRMPAFMARLSVLNVKLRLPFKVPALKIPLSKKLLIIIGSSVLTVGVAGAAAIAFWPSEPEPVAKPVVAKKTKKQKKAAAAALAAASAASAAEAARLAASAPSEATAQAPAASGPEESMDKLRRRLGEALAGGGKLEAGGPGELRVTARQGEAKPVAASRAVVRTADAANQVIDDGHIPAAAAKPGNVAARTAHADPESADAHPTPRNAKMTAAALQHLHWSYDGLGGPESWGKLKPEFAKCSTGARQSPIDIRDGIPVNLDAIRFDYKPSAFRVIDNGHTVQVNVAPGNFIEVSGKRFELQQFHFHRPSEERIDGKQFDMVAHLVHKDTEGKLAVVAVLLERGSAQAIVQTVWNNLPLEKGEEQIALAPMDLNQLLPAERSYYTYMGSLTTPPCSEGVLWMVMKKPVPIAPEQINIFARLYPMNARPIQSASGRMIKESN